MFGSRKTKKDKKRDRIERMERDDSRKIKVRKKRKYGKKYIQKSDDTMMEYKKSNTKINILLGAILVVVIASVLLSRYTKITEVQMEITTAEKEITELTEKRNVIKLELEEIKDSGWIEKQAGLRMNMRKASEDQIILLDIKETK